MNAHVMDAKIGQLPATEVARKKYEKWRAELDKENKTIRDGHTADNAFLGYRKCKLKVLARVKNERKK